MDSKLMGGVNLLTDRQDVVGELAVAIQNQQVWGGKKIKKESSKHIRLEDPFYVIWNTIDDLECYFFRIRSGEAHCWQCPNCPDILLRKIEAINIQVSFNICRIGGFW